MTLFEVSNSEITAWKSCRRKWWLHYYLRLRPKAREYTGALPLGSRLHRALERHYRTGEDLLAVWSELVAQDRVLMLVESMDTDKLDKEAELGRLMLEGYLDWVAGEGIDSDLEVIGIEEILKYDFPLSRGAITLIGKIDQRVVKKFTGTRAVLDFKSAISFDVWNKTAHMSPQLKTYMLLDKLTAKRDGDSRRIDGGIFRLLRKVQRGPRAQPPFYEDMYVSHNDYTLRSFWVQLTGVLQEIYDAKTALDSGADPMMVAHPNPTRDCTWSCFAGDTEVVTRQGIKRIDELADTEVELLIPGRYDGKSFTSYGTWQHHKVLPFGEQRLYEIHLRRGRQMKVVRATSDHLWWVDRGARRVTTTELSLGVVIPSARRNSWKNVQPVPPAIAQGFVFGDGTNMGSGVQAMLDVHPDKDMFMLDYFSMHPQEERSRTVAINGKTYESSFTRVRQIPERWNWLPSIDENAGFLASWLAGYFAADGTVSKAGQASIHSAAYEHLEFVRSVCAVLGIKSGPITTQMRRGVNEHETPLYQLSLGTRFMPLWMFLNSSHRQRVEESLSKPEHVFKWIVEKVVETDDVEPVYCAVVPGDEAFVLADDVVTSNCQFFNICSMFDDGSNVESAIEDNFEEVDNVYDYYGDKDTSGS